MGKLLKIVQLIIEKMVLFLFALVFIGTLISGNLNGQVLGYISVVGLILGLIYLVLFKLFGINITFKRFKLIKPKHKIGIFTLITGIYQFFILYNIAGETGFDSGIVKWAATSSTIEPGSYLNNYFSHSTNNLALMFSERWISHAMKFMGLTNFTIVLDVINLILIDIAILLMVLILKNHLKHRILWGILPFVLLTAPWIVVVYTDTVILPFVAGMIYIVQILMEQFKEQTITPLKSICEGILFGITALCAYLLKPSAIIIVLAIMIELFLNFSRVWRRINKKYGAVAIVMAVLSFGGLYTANKTFLNDQTVISINDDMTFTPRYDVYTKSLYYDGNE